MEASLKNQILEAADSALLPMGFVRAKRSQEWKKRFEHEQLWVHVNCGLGVFNPSLGVIFEELEARWGDLPGAVLGPSVKLAALFEPHRTYQAPSGISLFLEDLQAAGLPGIEQLRDREHVLSLLRDEEVRNWPTVSFSHRIRLGALLAVEQLSASDAKALIEHFEIQASGRDQLLPTFPDFVHALRQRIAV